jgi:hypothetical protein
MPARNFLGLSSRGAAPHLNPFGFLPNSLPKFFDHIWWLPVWRVSAVRPASRGLRPDPQHQCQILTFTGLVSLRLISRFRAMLAALLVGRFKRSGHKGYFGTEAICHPHPSLEQVSLVGPNPTINAMPPVFGYTLQSLNPYLPDVAITGVLFRSKSSSLGDPCPHTKPRRTWHWSSNTSMMLIKPRTSTALCCKEPNYSARGSFVFACHETTCLRNYV